MRQHETSRRDGWRRNLATAFAALAAITITTVAGAAQRIDGITVKFRSQAAANAPLTSAQLDALAGALQQGFVEKERTRDGAVVLTLQEGVSIDEARAALNRVRSLSSVLYANIFDATRAPTRNTAKSLAGAAPTDRLIVRFRDPARVNASTAQVPLDIGTLDRLGIAAGEALSYLKPVGDGSDVLAFMRRLPASEVQAIADRIAALPEVEYAEPDLIMFPQLAPNDAQYINQWHYFEPIGGVNLPATWDITTGSASMVVAVIDTGLLFNHPDLAGKSVAGYDFIDDFAFGNDNQPAQTPTCLQGNDPRFYDPFARPPCVSSRDADAADPGDWIDSADFPTTSSSWFWGCGVTGSTWHGTHVAGTIAAATNNVTGVAGINWQAKIQPARVLGKCGGYTSDIALAMRWTAGEAVAGVPVNTTPARVLNLSLGGNGACGTTFQNAINAALALNAVVAIAAGNSNDNTANHSPGNCNGVVTVGATQRQGYKSHYSNYGLVEIAAPGGGRQYPNTAIYDRVLSTLNDGLTSPNPAGYNYVGYAGTSMATPHIAGIVSLMLSVNPSLTPSQVLAKLTSMARAFPTGGPVCDTAVTRPPSSSWYSCQCTTSICGAGIVDAQRSVLASIGFASVVGVASSMDPSAPSASVTFTATVNGLVPTGTVTFMDGGAPIVGCTGVPLAGTGDTRTATCNTPPLVAGAHFIVASYAGDSNNVAAASPTFGQSVAVGSWLGFLYGANQAIGSGSAVTAGANNLASGLGAFVGAGQSNIAAGVSSLVIGGFDNRALAIDSLVGAGAGNRATGARSVVVGGGYNLASGQWSFIGGGGRETGSGVAGASAEDHIAAGKWSTVGGGVGNRAGTLPVHNGATVAGGEQNQAINVDAAVGGGIANVAGGLASTVPGGSNNAASGDYSVAFGRRAKATQAGALALADSSNFDFASAVANEFAVRAVGGTRVVSAINGSGTPTAGVTLAAGAGAWASLSDRAMKVDMTPVDAQSVLARVVAMPVSTWRYSSEVSGALHMGPTAQDFHAAFGLGDSDRTITTVDTDGVALAAIRGLQHELDAQEALIARQREELARLRARLASLETTSAALAQVKATLRTLIPSAETAARSVTVNIP